MTRKNLTYLLIILAIFAFSVSALVFPLFGRPGMSLGLDLKGGLHLVYRADMSNVEPGQESSVIEGVISVIQNRINPLGVTEPMISRLGENQIVVELPGASVSDVQKDRIGRTALLEFREQVANDKGETTWIPARATVNGQEKVLNSSLFKRNTYVSQESFGGILLVFEWDEEGSKLSEIITGRLIGKPLGIFEGDEPLLGDDGKPIAPIVRSVIKDRGQIEGLSFNEATELSKQLNAGRLPVPLELAYEQNVSPVAGANFVDLSIRAGIIGILLIMAFMIAYYRLPGLVASLALLFYGALVLALFKLIPVTLTLAGIGGFVVSVGMAVDANVLIFERLKEELRLGRTLGAAVEAGFGRAWTAIRDSNVTTFVATIILYIVGSNIAAGAPVKGFALTLTLGVAVSMFTAILVTRILLRLFIASPLRDKPSLFTPYLVGKKK